MKLNAALELEDTIDEETLRFVNRIYVNTLLARGKITEEQHASLVKILESPDNENIHVVDLLTDQFI